MPAIKPMRTKTLPALALVAGLLTPATPGLAQDKPSLYESAQAILAENCLSCHGAAQMSGLDLRQREALLKGGTRGPALVPGKAEDSLLFQVAAHVGETADASRVAPPAPGKAGSHPPMDRCRRCLGGKHRGHRPGRGRARLVVVPQAAAALLASGGRQGVAGEPDRCLRAGQAARARPAGGAFRRQADLDSTRLFRPGRPPPHAGAGGPLPPGRLAPGLSVGGERVAGLSPLRGTLGAALAGRGSLRRLGRVRNRCLLPPCLALPGLRHQVLQRRQALRPLPPGADRGRRALAQQPGPGGHLRHPGGEAPPTGGPGGDRSLRAGAADG